MFEKHHDFPLYYFLCCLIHVLVNLSLFEVKITLKEGKYHYVNCPCQLLCLSGRLFNCTLQTANPALELPGGVSLGITFSRK